MTCVDTASIPRRALSPIPPTQSTHRRAAGSRALLPPFAAGRERRSSGSLGIDDIVPEALHRQVGWDIRHHFMAEKIVDRFGLVLPRDRELIRQLAIVYVLEGMTTPPAGLRSAAA